ncbi:acyl carrier protein [Leptolyngbya sp. FACHB-16]|uniref:acyl carrier protein n=1 Tax=unclassified Leptolyngbya TaxID=2650499 RepID=UPI0016858E27|nr:acyl carrier protein [Leptolyngbya sp. FACHB-16]MBD2153044.1 acyl carrier protein [Leptolyngbya sp. FACHB-16]
MKPQLALGTQESQPLPSAAEIQAWITTYLADLLEIEPDEIDVTVPFDCYGLDSAVAVGMTGDLEDWLGQKLDPTLLYDYPTVESFAHHLAVEFETTA